MIYYVFADSTGKITGVGQTPDGTLPLNAVECTATEAAGFQQYAVDLSAAVPAIIPAPAAQLLAQSQDAQITALRAACQAQIVAGFSSAALGSSATYGSDTITQSNITRAAASAMGGSLWVADSSGAWTLAAHTQAQAIQARADMWAHIQTAQARYAMLLAQVRAATTVAQAQAVFGNDGERGHDGRVMAMKEEALPGILHRQEGDVAMNDATPDSQRRLTRLESEMALFRASFDKYMRAVAGEEKRLP